MQISGSQLNKIYELHLHRVNTVSRTMESGIVTSDRLTISSRAAEVQKIQQQVTAMSDVRQSKIQEIKTAVQEGRYEYTDREIASAIFRSAVQGVKNV